jgi:hypothetical protein
LRCAPALTDTCPQAPGACAGLVRALGEPLRSKPAPIARLFQPLPLVIRGARGPAQKIFSACPAAYLSGCDQLLSEFNL